MEKLDRLGWAAGTSFTSHGARIGIRVSDPAVLERLPNRLPPGWKFSSSAIVDGLYSLIAGSNDPGAKVRRYNLLYLGSGLLARTMDLDEVLASLESNLHFHVALMAQGKLFVHSGVVGWHGQAIIIPGRSRSGKTSLVEALLRAGATYYSDEYAVFDPQGRVHPYPKPLSVRDGLRERPHRYSLPAPVGRVGTQPLPVGLIVVTEYEPGARWHPKVLSPGRAVLALLNHTVLARIRPDFALDILRRVVGGAMTFKGKRGEANEVTTSLLRHGEGSQNTYALTHKKRVERRMVHDTPGSAR